MKLSKKDIQKIQLDILLYIDKFCKKNNIEYFMNYGTLLGAVRHKGFIPWDDDIDISMTRENYEKFNKIFNNKNSKYKILSLKTDKQYYNNFIKVYDSSTVIKSNKTRKNYETGIFIDIFPIDYFEDKSIINKAYILESLKYISFSKKEHILYKNSPFKNMYRLLLWYLLRLINPRIFAILIENLIKKYKSKNPTFAAFIISTAKEKDILPLNIGKKLILLNFEGHLFSAPKNYDEVLSSIYGNYMIHPEKEMQIDHQFDAYKKYPY